MTHEQQKAEVLKTQSIFNRPPPISKPTPEEQKAELPKHSLFGPPTSRPPPKKQMEPPKNYIFGSFGGSPVIYSRRTLCQLMCPFENLLAKVYNFAYANIEEKAKLYIHYKELRPFYMALIHLNEPFNVSAFFNSLPFDICKEMIIQLDPSKVSQLVDSIPNELQQKEIIDSAFTWFSKDEYAEFVTYIEDDSLQLRALKKAQDQDFIRNWIP
jgi:hypothetical protein